MQLNKKIQLLLVFVNNRFITKEQNNIIVGKIILFFPIIKEAYLQIPPRGMPWVLTYLPTELG